MNRAYSLLTVRAVDDEQRVIRGVATTPTPDRMGDIVEPLGVRFKNPMPLLHQHRSDEPVGTVRFDAPTEDGITFEARLPQIAEPPSLKDRIDTAWAEVKAGLVRAVSIGFRAIEHSVMENGGWRFIETEVLELSLVTVPANADATITTIRSIDTAQRAASGRSNAGRTTIAGASARVQQTVTRPKEARRTMTTKTYGEQIAAFEATRAAKSARMDELMNGAAERGETLNPAETEEYDGLAEDLKSVDAHLVRLREREKMSAAAAVPVAGNTPAEAGQARAGVHVTSVKANLPPGIRFTRYALALARGRGNLSDALAIALGNKAWHDQTPEVETVLRAAVSAGTTTDSTWAAPLVEYQDMAAEFIEYLRPRTIIGRIAGLRRVPFKVKVPRQTAVASVGWVGEGKPKPVGSSAFDSVTLDHHKISGIIALTEELVKLSNPAAEGLAREDLASGVIQLMDLDFVDPDKAAVANVSPASIIDGVTPRAASGTDYAAFKADVKAALQPFFDANLAPSVIIMREDLALALSLMETSLGNPQFPGLSQGGGTLLTMPVVTSMNVPYTEDSPQEGSPIIFLAAPEILLADEGQVMIDVSREASVQMNTAPDDPASASTVLTSLWQHNMVGIRAERMITWVKRRSPAAQYISAAKYV